METKKYLRQVIADRDELISVLFKTAFTLVKEIELQRAKLKTIECEYNKTAQENGSIKDLLQPIFDKMEYKL